MDFIDYSYILRLGSRLELFTEVRRGLFRCRCPFCGDSKKRKNLSRLYIFETDKSAGSYCHNCSFSSDISFLLKSLDSELFKEYRLEKFGKNVKGENKQIKNLSTFTQKTLKKHLKDAEIYQLPDCTPVINNPHSLEYLKHRKVPESFYNHIFYVNDVPKFVTNFEKYADSKLYSVQCLAIPFYVNQSEEPPYIMLRSIDKKFFMNLEISDGPKLWGLAHLNTPDAFCFEAPIDAMMVTGGVSMSGIHLSNSARLLLKENVERTILVFDNDYRKNKQVIRVVKQAIESNDWVVIYDDRFRWKDANECICSNEWSHEQLREYLVERTFRGARAKLELARWC